MSPATAASRWNIGTASRHIRRCRVLNTGVQTLAELAKAKSHNRHARKNKIGYALRMSADMPLGPKAADQGPAARLLRNRDFISLWAGQSVSLDRKSTRLNSSHL